MPEGPECKIIGEYLNNKLKDTKCMGMLIHENSRYARHKKPENFDKLKFPLTITSVNVKGKLIWFSFSNGMYMLNTLGMSGIWTTSKTKHCDFEIIYTNQDLKKLSEDMVIHCNSIYFKDVRHFGTLKILENKQQLDKKLKTIGHDVLNLDINFEQFEKLLLKRSDWTLPKFLMNQKYLSGIGNYLKSEILYDCRISPHTKIKDLNKDLINQLFNSISKIPIQSYNSQGVSLRDYEPPEKYRSQLESFELKVYDNDIDENGYTIIREKTDDKRTTHWVPQIQIF